jgi:hypothetical protein
LRRGEILRCFHTATKASYAYFSSFTSSYSTSDTVSSVVLLIGSRFSCRVAASLLRSVVDVLRSSPHTLLRFSSAFSIVGKSSPARASLSSFTAVSIAAFFSAGILSAYSEIASLFGTPNCRPC